MRRCLRRTAPLSASDAPLFARFAQLFAGSLRALCLPHTPYCTYALWRDVRADNSASARARFRHREAAMTRLLRPSEPLALCLRSPIFAACLPLQTAHRAALAALGATIVDARVCGHGPINDRGAFGDLVGGADRYRGVMGGKSLQLWPSGPAAHHEIFELSQDRRPADAAQHEI
jgi:hypothetical protein